MEIVLGALCPKLSEQIPGLSEHFDKDADAITRLVVRGMLTDSEATKARKRLLKRIEREAANVEFRGGCKPSSGTSCSAYDGGDK